MRSLQPRHRHRRTARRPQRARRELPPRRTRHRRGHRRRQQRATRRGRHRPRRARRTRSHRGHHPRDRDHRDQQHPSTEHVGPVPDPRRTEPRTNHPDHHHRSTRPPSHRDRHPCSTTGQLTAHPASAPLPRTGCAVGPGSYLGPMVQMGRYGDTGSRPGCSMPTTPTARRVGGCDRHPVPGPAHGVTCAGALPRRHRPRTGDAVPPHRLPRGPRSPMGRTGGVAAWTASRCPICSLSTWPPPQRPARAGPGCGR